MTDPLPAWLYASAVPALILGGAVAVLNFYLSFIRYHVVRWRGREYRFVSGFPLIGSVLLVPAAVGLAGAGSLPLLALAVLFIALDTGGVAWFLPIMLAELIRARRGR